MEKIKEEMLKIYIFVDDYIKAIGNWRKSNNKKVSISDAEIMTMALSKGLLGVDSLKGTYNKIVENYNKEFPVICGYKQWLARVNQLSDIVGRMSLFLGQPSKQQLYLMDSMPISLAKPIRYGRVRLLRDDGAYFGKSSKGWYFGFKLNVLRNIDGKVVNAILTPGNFDDRDPALALLSSVDSGVTLGDLGYRGADFSSMLLEEVSMLFITRADSSDTHSKWLISCVRQKIESFFSILWRRFIDRVFARSFKGLWTSLKLLLLFYNLSLAGVIF